MEIIQYSTFHPTFFDLCVKKQRASMEPYWIDSHPYRNVIRIILAYVDQMQIEKCRKEWKLRMNDVNAQYRLNICYGDDTNMLALIPNHNRKCMCFFRIYR